MKSLFRYFIDRPLLVNLLFVAIILLGYFFSTRMKREAVPVVDMRQVVITTVYPGASPEDVELNVTIPVEDELKGVTGIKEYTSVSMENLSRITVKLDPDVSDIEAVKRDIRRAVDNVKNLPKEVEERPFVWEMKAQNFSVIEVALSSGKLSEQKLIAVAKRLRKKIERLSMVARVEPSGLRDREIQIKVDLAKMNRYHLTFRSIVNALRSRNINLSGGNLESYLSEKGIITVSRFEQVTDVANVILRSNFEGQRVLLKDVARVSDTFEKKTDITRYNGKRGVALSIIKKESADVMRCIDQIKELIRKFKKIPLAKNVSFSFINDMSEETRNKLDIVVSNAVMGLILIVLVLFTFLNLKTALWTAAGLPVSIFLAIIFMYISGVTINSVSLSGIIVVLGMLVDDAIIIAENSYRHFRSGKRWKEAALLGVTEVSLPVTATIFTTIIAFLPILFMEGTTGDFAYEIPLVIAFTLLASLFEAFFILPQHLSHTSKKKIATDTKQKPKDKRFIVWMEKHYRVLLARMLRNRYKLLGVFILLFILSVGYAVTNMKFVLFDEKQAHIFYFSGETSRGSSLQKTADEVKKIEKILAAIPNNVIHSYKSQVGHNVWGVATDVNYFSFLVYMTPANKRKQTARDIVRLLKKKIGKIKPIKKTHFTIESGGPPVGRPIEVQVVSSNDKQRTLAVKAIRNFLKKQQGVQDLDDNYELGKDELRIRLNYDRIARYGLQAYQVAEVIRTAYNGTVVTHMQTPKERIGYRVLLDKRYRRDRYTLGKLKISNQEGRLIPIKNLVYIKERRTIKRIYHFDGDRSVNVSADVDLAKNSVSSISAKLGKEIQRLQKIYPETIFHIKGEAEESARTIKSLLVALGIALCGVYLLLVLLFKSFTQPVLVIVAIPFGIIGVILAFAIHGTNFSMMGVLGIIGLTGVVVNDSLVMIDYVNKKWQASKKKDLLSVIVEGATTRLRPILLTTITTAAGLLPTAYGIGGYDFTIAPMVLAIAWGLLFATVLTLFLVPALYQIDRDIRAKSKKFMGKMKQRLRLFRKS